MPFEKALDSLSKDERFRATVYAMNTLLIYKGIYTHEEFEQLFVEWATKHGGYSSQVVTRETKASA